MQPKNREIGVIFYFIFMSAKNHESNDFHRIDSAFSTQHIFHAECMETQAVTPWDI